MRFLEGAAACRGHSGAQDTMGIRPVGTALAGRLDRTK